MDFLLGVLHHWWKSITPSTVIVIVAANAQLSYVSASWKEVPIFMTRKCFSVKLCLEFLCWRGCSKFLGTGCDDFGEGHVCRDMKKVWHKTLAFFDRKCSPRPIFHVQCATFKISAFLNVTGIIHPYWRGVNLN